MELDVEMKYIVNDVSVEDFVLVGRAIRYLLMFPDRKDCILQYGPIDTGLTLYVKRNKASITVSKVK
jgi:hypothetical protein